MSYLTKHSIVIVVEGTTRRLWIAKNSAAESPTVEQGQFQLTVWAEDTSSPEICKFRVDEYLLFDLDINGSAKRLNIGDACREILTILCKT